MKKIVTFGEILLRLTPPGFLKLSQTHDLCATFGGSETNVAVSLAHLGLKSDFVTRLPQNGIAEACIMDLRSHGVGTDNIVYGGDRLGLYYSEKASSMRTSQVVYDRANSSFCTARPGEIDWKKVFADADWFHWSGIGPSLSESAVEVIDEALAVARQMGLTISSDLNYRKNLWKYGKKAEEVMPALAKQCDVLFGTEEEYNKAFGVKPVSYNATCKADEQIDIEAHTSFCKQVMAQAPQCKKMFVALRNVLTANHHVLTGILYTSEGKFYTAHTYHIENIVDCVGVGDAFAAGIIYGLIKYPDNGQKALDVALAASALKNTISGDYNLVSAAEVEALAAGHGSGNISR